MASIEVRKEELNLFIRFIGSVLCKRIPADHLIVMFQHGTIVCVPKSIEPLMSAADYSKFTRKCECLGVHSASLYEQYTHFGRAGPDLVFGGIAEALKQIVIDRPPKAGMHYRTTGETCKYVDPIDPRITSEFTLVHFIDQDVYMVPEMTMKYGKSVMAVQVDDVAQRSVNYYALDSWAPRIIGVMDAASHMACIEEP